MKTLNKLYLFIVITASIFPVKIYAQPEGEGWISLGEAIKDSFKPKRHQGFINIEPSHFLRQVFIEGIAFKENKKRDYRISSYLMTEKVDGFEGNEYRGSDKTKIDQDFEIKINDKKVNKKYISKTDNGWKIYKFDDLQRILFVGEYLPEKYLIISKYGYEEDPIFSNLYVKLGDGSKFIDQALALLQEQKQKQREEREAATIKERQERMSKAYSTPSDKGFTKTHSETLKDGTIIEHYKEGIRYIKKPNGDFASFIEPKDKRDPKTLDLIKGYTLPIEDKAKLIGDFQITFANGVIGKKNILDEQYIAPNGDILTINSDLITPENLEIANKLFIYSPQLYPMDYSIFMGSGSENFASKDLYYFDNEKKYLFIVTIGATGEKKNLSWSSYVDYDNKREFTLTETINEKPYAGYVYDFSNEGLSQRAVRVERELNGGRYIPVKNKFKNIEEGKYTFENGDYIPFVWTKNPLGERVVQYGDAFLTLIDGSTFEKIEDKYRIKRPDGSKYVGTLKGNALTDAAENYIKYGKKGKKNFYTGYYTNPKGEEEEYNGGKNRTNPDKVDNDVSPEQQELFKKYGEDNVLNAEFGIIKVGMPLELIRLFWTPTYDGGSAGTSAYTLKTGLGFGKGNRWYFRVNEKTGKVISVTKLNS